MNSPTKIYRNTLSTLLLLSAMGAAAQNNTQSKKSQTQRIIATVDSFNVSVPREKVFVHTDRSFYINRDTIWLKAYILDADLNYSRQSGFLYTELIDDTGKVVLREAMPVKLGISFSQMILDEKTVPEGSYTLRAYTNWMQNQGTASFFTERIYISTAGNNDWLVTKDVRLKNVNSNENLHVILNLNKRGGKGPVLLQDVAIKLMDGDKVLQSDRMKTDIAGELDFNFNLSVAKTKSLYIFLKNADKQTANQQLVIPLQVDRPQNIDLQFMPEGGKMVAGLPSVIGFKAIGEDGKSVDVQGDVLDSKGNIAANFHSSHMGMGSFLLTPLPGEAYTAMINGGSNIYHLPAAMPSGIILHVDAPADKDSVVVKVLASDAMEASGQVFSLVAVSGSKVCYAANLPLANGMIRGIIGKNNFKSGIVHFTVFDTQQNPVAERLIFIDHHDQLKIQVIHDPVYPNADSAALHIKVTTKNNIPVQGSFSLSLTDDKQVKVDTANMPNISSCMLLTGDLKGNIEMPGYYFNSKNTDRYQALDNLLLTQGWVNYGWQDVFSPVYKPIFRAEPEMVVTGNISRIGGKSVSGLKVVLLSPKKPILMMDTVSDATGHFTFRNLPRLDTANFLLQVKDVKGKMFEANVNVDEFKPANTFGLDNSLVQPWYVNIDTTLLNNIKSSIAYNKLEENIKYPSGTHVLKEVKINAVKSIKGSHNLNGPGQADQVLDEEDMKKAGKQTLLDVLRAKIKGFQVLAVYEKKLKVIVDGINADFYPDWKYLTHEEWFSQFSAEDVKGVEVLYDDKYNGKYVVQYNPELMPSPRWEWPAYLEITTWSGNGIFEKRKRGVYIYRPLPVVWPKEFYHPKYSPKGNVLADLRPTVLWEPNIITDTAGKATVWFYAKSKATNYTGIINGSNLNGSIGSAIFTIKSK